MPIIPVIGRGKQKDQEFKASLSYEVNLSQAGLQKIQKKEIEKMKSLF